MSKVKVGDTVKILSCVYESLPEGTVGKIQSKEMGWDDEGDVAVVYYLEGDGYNRTPLLDHEFEVVS